MEIITANPKIQYKIIQDIYIASLVFKYSIMEYITIFKI